MGKLAYFLGLQVTYKSNGDLFINHAKYVKDILHKAGMDDSFAVNTVCQYMHAPTNIHLGMVKTIMRFLKGTMHCGLTYILEGSLQLNAYSDSDWVADLNTRRSITGYLSIALSLNLVQHSRIKHLETGFHFVHERVQSGDLSV
ncbi:uncharacterized mitochondrial protein AtMg00240-like [Malus sylvestris]|uniref:uncharacterized mitochondrial protein AtMg00240-like n=1 Tax=Malus sylvestris TaxID=3752 RepID=UPI0021AC7124|nr:uncharacterized mitochondrial protein AtMg00240-like [Malus sylvestris]